MKKLNIRLFAIAFGLSIHVSAMAEHMTPDEQLFLKNNITKEYDAAIAKCDALSGNNDACIARAQANRNKATEALDQKANPKIKHPYKLKKQNSTHDKIDANSVKE